MCLTQTLDPLNLLSVSDINGIKTSKVRFQDLRRVLLDGGWTTKSPADGDKSLSLPKSICSQEVVSSCLGKDLSAWRRSTISGTDYSGRDHITVKYCFWITRLVKKHSYSVSELPDGLFCSRSQRTTTR